MFTKEDPTETTLEFAGREYRCRALPSEYQPTDKRTYYASACGEILSVSKNGRTRVLRGRLLANYQGEKRKVYSLGGPTANQPYGHRLVASAWCDGKGSLCPAGNVRDAVNHLDSSMLNNAAYNLHWVSTKENVHHARVVMPAAEAERRIVNGTPTATDEYLLGIAEEWLAGEPLEDLIDWYGKADVLIAIAMVETGVAK